MKKRRSTSGLIADILIITFLSIFALSIIFPFYNMLRYSVATFEDSAYTAFTLLPRSFTLENYERLFEDQKMPTSILVSTRNVIFGTAMSMVMTIFCAYVLSRKNLPGRKFMFYFVIFTMYFGGGLIPWYMVLKDLGFVDSYWVMTVPSMLSAFNMILVRNFFLSLPESLEESAKLDGAGEMTIMWRIVVPLSGPIMATVGLFYAVAFWNEWWNAMLFIQDNSKVPLALLLRRIIIENSMSFENPMAASMAAGKMKVHSRSLQMAAVTVATIPILCVYPFVQRHFTKGIMLGAIKA